MWFIGTILASFLNVFVPFLTEVFLTPNQGTKAENA